MELKAKELTAEAFTPFGVVIEKPGRLPDAEGPGWLWWGETALLPGDERPYGIGYLDVQPAELSFDWAERHMRSMELLIPCGGDCLVYVAPPDYPDEPERMPPLEEFQAFRVRHGQGVLIGKGVWHGAPMAVNQPLNVIVLLLQNSGREDGYLVRFVETPVKILV